MLIDIYRKHPDERFSASGDDADAMTLRQVLSDEASQLEGCDDGLAKELDRALDAGT